MPCPPTETIRFQSRSLNGAVGHLYQITVEQHLTHQVIASCLSGDDEDVVEDDDNDECVMCAPTGQQWSEAVEQEVVCPR